MSSASILPLFSLLSSHDPVTRLDASFNLLNSIPVDNKPENFTKDSDTDYSLKRLIKGLASSNALARQSFAVTLTTLLTQLPVEKALESVSLILSPSHPVNDSNDERNTYFAILFGIHSLFRSGILFKEESTIEPAKETVQAVLSLSARKSWLKEPAYWVLLDGLNQLIPSDGPNWKQEFLDFVIQRVLLDSRERARGWSPEKIALVLLLQAHNIVANYTIILSPDFYDGNVFGRASLKNLARILKGDSTESNEPQGPTEGSNAIKTAKGSTFFGANPHIVWDYIFDAYFSKTPSSSSVAWEEFWKVAVDDNMFNTSSTTHKATGFALLTRALGKIPQANVPALFKESVIRILSNNLRKGGDERTLGKTAEQFITTLVKYLEENQKVASPILELFIAPGVAFDSRTIEKIIAKLDVEGSKKYSANLRSIVLDVIIATEGAESGFADERQLAAKRVWAFDQLLLVAKNQAHNKDGAVINELLEFFGVIGWFEETKQGKGPRSYIPKHPFSEDTRAAGRSRFFSILTHLPIEKVANNWISTSLAILDAFSKDKHFTRVFTPTENSVLALEKSIRKAAKKLDDSDKSQTGKVLVDAILLLEYDEADESEDILQTLQDCMQVLFPGKNTGKKVAQDDGLEDGETAAEPGTVLVDTLLELLHRPSTLVKRISQFIFAGFIDEIGAQGLELLLEQATPVEEGEIDGEMEVDGETSEKDSGSESDDSEDSNNDDDENVEVDEDFKKELLAALEAEGIADLGDNDDEENDGEEEEASLDDEQMMALDDRLADIFRLQKRQPSKKAQIVEDLHYRLRVIDLIEPLVKQRPANALVPLLVVPLFNVVRKDTPLETELISKCSKLLRHVVAGKRDIPKEVDIDMAIEELARLHKITKSIESSTLTTLCAQTAIYLSECAESNSDKQEAIATLFFDSFEQYISTKNTKTRLQPALTTEFVKRCPEVAWVLFPKLVEIIKDSSKSVNLYRRLQTIEVTQALLTSYVALKIKVPAKILKVIPDYSKALSNLLRAGINDASFDANKLKTIIKVTISGVRSTISVSDPSTAQKLWDIKEFSKLEEELKSTQRLKNSNGVLLMLRQVASVAGVKSSSGEKRKTEAESEKSRKKAKKIASEVEVEIDHAEESEPTEKRKRKGKK